MADRIPAGVDPGGLRNIIGNQINPATEDTLSAINTNVASLAAFQIPKSDAIYATYPNAFTEVYTYKLLGATVAVVTVTYTDDTKENLQSAIIT